MKRPPAELDGTARALWRATVRALETSGRDLREVDLRAVERFVRTSRLADRIWEQLPESLTDVGANHQEIAHPLIRSALHAETHAARFAEDLGLSRKPARREGRPTGAASAPDRAVDRPRTIRRVA